jgi:SAM-dependent methyltransferase
MASRRGDEDDPPVRNLSFGSVAADYDRYRLEYPGDLVDAVLEYAGRPVADALEVGAGTGKATRRFAERGIRVTALEPDERMAERLAGATRGLPVHPVVTSFEDFATADRFDLVFAAASWHWVDPAVRTARAAELLRPGGVLALIGLLGDARDPQLIAAVEAIEQRSVPASDIVALHPWSVSELTDGGFVDVVQTTLPHVLITTADAYLGRLGTVSAYLMLSATERAEVLGRIRAVLPERFELDGAVQLVLARRA